MKKREIVFPQQNSLFGNKASMPISGSPTQEEFRRTRSIDAGGPLTKRMMIDSFYNAWFMNYRPTTIRTSSVELLAEAKKLVCTGKSPFGADTWNHATFELDPSMPPTEILFRVPDHPDFSTRIINIQPPTF